MTLAARVGGSVSLQNVISDLSRRLAQLEPSTAAIPASWVAMFTVTPNTALNGAQIALQLASVTGIEVVCIVRSFSMDPTTAKVLAIFRTTVLGTSNEASYSDNDPALVGRTAYYWLAAVSENPSTAPAYSSPQALNATAADTAPPDPLIAFDASASAAAGTVITIGVSFQAPEETSFGSCRIFVEGYNGNAAAVAIAEFTSDPGSFQLQATGETVTLLAVSVNKAGYAAPLTSALTKALTLNGTSTVPCEVMNATATSIATGVQLGFPSGPEATITQYVISRAVLGAGFGTATSIGTVASTGAAAYTFLDATGLAGQFEWYVQAQNPTGLSAASTAITLFAILSSAQLPPNVPANTSNFATVDSVLTAGSGSATARIYGTGGAGTSWTRQTGFGTQTFPTGTVAPLGFTLVYYVLWTGTAYVATTTYPAALPDGYVWVGKITTCNNLGGGGVSGGGGASGGAGGRPTP